VDDLTHKAEMIISHWESKENNAVDDFSFFMLVASAPCI